MGELGVRIGAVTPDVTTFAALLLFAESGTLDTTTVDWGDGSANEVYPPGTIFTAQHPFAPGAAYTVTLEALFTDASTDVVEVGVFSFGGAGPGAAHSGSDRVDLIAGGDGNDTLSGLAGHDWVFGGAGDDRILGGDGDDSLFGGVGNDSLRGGSGNNRLVGDAGDDRMIGGRAYDFLSGGAGNDTLSGGQDRGQDDYVVNRAEIGTGVDEFRDFEAGVDQIHINGLIPFGDPVDIIIDAHPKAATPGLPTVLYKTLNGRLFVDLDGEAGNAPVLIARIQGAPALSASDFAFFG